MKEKVFLAALQGIISNPVFFGAQMQGDPKEAIEFAKKCAELQIGRGSENMSETKHTPGPWDFEGPEHSIIIWAGADKRICFMTSDGPSKENAKLIAAAPEMLSAHQWVVDQMCEGFCKDLPSMGSYNTGMDRDCSACRSRAAIARATSEKP